MVFSPNVYLYAWISWHCITFFQMSDLAFFDAVTWWRSHPTDWTNSNSKRLWFIHLSVWSCLMESRPLLSMSSARPTHLHHNKTQHHHTHSNNNLNFFLFQCKSNFWLLKSDSWAALLLFLVCFFFKGEVSKCPNAVKKCTRVTTLVINFE